MAAMDEAQERRAGVDCRGAAVVWLAGWGCWALGVFWVIPTAAGIFFSDMNTPVPGSTEFVIDLAAFLGRPRIAFPIGLGILGWTWLLLAGPCRPAIRAIAWTADGTLWAAGIASLAALLSPLFI
jgi:hypothetical protein